MQHKAIIICGPSGTGKGEITNYLLSHLPTLSLSISATTRPKRAHETEGKEYYFLTPQQFSRKIRQDAFIEWQKVYERGYYGTLRSEVDRLWKEGRVPLFEVEVKGALHLKKQLGSAGLVIFITPSKGDLEEKLRTLIVRLLNRKTETEETLAQRIVRAIEELGMQKLFKTTLVNEQGKLQKTQREALALVKKFLKITTPREEKGGKKAKEV